MLGKFKSIHPVMSHESSKWEWRILSFSFFVYFIWQVNAIFHHGSWGQDFGSHMTWIQMAKTNPVLWFTTYDAGRTNPPMFHFLASLVFDIVHGDTHALEVVALLAMIINMIALYLIYQVIREIVSSLIMRLACMIFLLFLPFAMIHAVVLAADSLATPVFLIIVYLFTLLTKECSNRKFLFVVSAITLLLMFAISIKFTFVSLLPASIIAYLILYRSGHLNRNRMISAIVAILLLPTVFGYLELHQYRSQVKYNLGISKVWENPIHSPFINLRSLLMVKKVDSKLLSAPAYNFSTDGKSYDLLRENYYSYPGLLHLAMFTDVLNIYQNDPTDAYFGPRTSYAQKMMMLSVKWGILFSLLAAIAVPLMIFISLLHVYRKQGNYWAITSIAAVLSCAFFFNIVLFLPEVPGVYNAGYWLPRLVAPALICFFMLAFSFFDRVVVRHSRSIAWIFLVFVILQSAVHLSFLFPYNNGVASNTVARGNTPLPAAERNS